MTAPSGASQQKREYHYDQDGYVKSADASHGAEDAEALRRLLGPHIVAKEQSLEGSYGGSSREISDSEHVAHFNGDRTFALALVKDGTTLLAGVDIDERFTARLRLLEHPIRRRGLYAATIATTGSDSERGKVVTFFARPRAEAGARKLYRDMVAEARDSDISWGIEDPRKLAVYPLRGDGGLLRIGGRNRTPDRRAAGTDRFFAVDRSPRRLSQVIPARRVRLRGEPVPVPTPPLGKWLQRYSSNGLTYTAGSKGVMRVLVRAAFEYLRYYGLAQTLLCREAYLGWSETVWLASPAMRGPSPTGDDRTERSWSRRVENAWGYALSKATKNQQNVTSHSPLRGQGGNKRCDICPRVLAVPRSVCATRGISSDAVTVSYREMARHAGLSDPQIAYRHARHLIAAGAIVKHDGGTRGEKGLPAIWGLVDSGETPEQVLQRGSQHSSVIRRHQHRDRRAVNGASKPSNTNTARRFYKLSVA